MNAQSVSLKDERKRMLLDGIKPAQTVLSPDYKYSKPESKVIPDNNLLGTAKSYKSGGAEYDGKYSTESLEATLKGVNLLLPDSTCVETKMVVEGGKTYLIPKKEYEYQLDKLSQRQRLQGPMLNVTYGGLNLSGWKKKKLSKKSREILEKLYGMKIEE